MRMMMLVLAATALGISSCATPPPEKPQVNLAFSGKERIQVPAGRFEFIDNYKPPEIAPHIEHEKDYQPTHLVRQWLNERLKPSATDPGKMTVEIIEASVVEATLPTEGGVGGIFKNEAERKLVGSLKWSLKYDGPEFRWKTDAFAEATQTISEQATLNQVDKAYIRVIEALADHLDKRVEDQINLLNQARDDANATN